MIASQLINNNNACILITTQFPDPLIINELPYLIKKFDRIFLFALSVTHLPQNFLYNVHLKIYNLQLSGSIFIKIKCIINGVFFHRGRVHWRVLQQLAHEFSFYGRAHLAYRKIIKILKIENIKNDNVLFYSFWLAIPALTAALVRNYYNKKYKKSYPCISRAHGYDLYNYTNTYGCIPFHQKIISMVDYIYPCSFNGMQYLNQCYPSAKHKIAVRYLGTIDHGLNPRNTDCIIFVTCSYLIPLKRVDFFAKVFIQLCEQHVDAIWHCIGDGPAKKDIINILQTNHCTNNVIFHGYMSNAEVFEFYKKTPVTYFVNVSSSEGLPVSIMEAMSMGIPCIATNVGGTSELVNEANGLIISADVTLNDLVTIIKKQLELNESKYMEKRFMARQTWLNRFNADTNYKKFANELHALVCN